MTVPQKYANNYVSIKFMLSSYRALSDARTGIDHLEKLMKDSSFLFSEWRVIWLGVCTTLRSAIDLFKIDQKICISREIGSQIKCEWEDIKKNSERHPIYWNFLHRERNNIIHEYKWSAYEAWMKPDGSVQSPPSILGRLLVSDGASAVLLMKHGDYAGRDSLDLLKEAADWVEARIFAAVVRAGFDPEEKRGLWDFREMPKSPVGESSVFGRFLEMRG